MKDFNFVDSQSPEVIEELYEKYQKDPSSIEESWRLFFKGFDYGSLPDSPPTSRHLDIADPYKTSSSSTLSAPLVGASSIVGLIEAYRKLGHLYAKVNPLGNKEKSEDLLDPKRWGFSEKDMEQEFSDEAKQIGAKGTKLKDIISHLKKTYCGSIGSEYKYISNESLVSWIQKRIEPEQNQLQFTSENRKAILKDIVFAEGFESFLNTKFVGKKRFSLEGGTSLVPALESLLDYGAQLGVKDAVIGMAHRGRLNVLVNVLKKTYKSIFNEFEGGFLPNSIQGDGDVKYHLGFSTDRKTPSGDEIHISLSPNPSHLEFISPVLEGITRSKQDLKYKEERTKVLPISIHGDAAFAGQGVVYETANMGQLQGFTTGGTIHIVINNQIGFTTNPKDSRSTLYCSDVMKMLEVPIFHVNGDDPEAVVQCMHLALDIRQKFGIDVLIDLICYRKYGHNEADEPRFTQPKMYEIIDKQKSPGEKYAAKLIDQSIISEKDLTKIKEDFKSSLDSSLDEVRNEKPDLEVQYLQDNWKGIKVPEDKDIFSTFESKVKKDVLQDLAKNIASVPSDFNPVKRLKRLVKDRWEMAEGKKPMDWGMAENLCYASLLIEKIPVRITGQDVRRGTFSHRHAAWTDAKSGKRYIPMNHILEEQEKLYIYDSLLSETAVLGFEFGYSMANPGCLIIWEAQFGDFANGAQVIIDQFITSSQSKWQRLSGLVLLLPHGYEGQGPEHSSARLERFLQMSAENNIQVANLTSPAQLFHILRRQIKRDFRLPLVIMSPKSLLRHPKVTTTFEELSETNFEEILADELSPSRVERLVLCSGKVYFDIAERREEKSDKKVGIVRIEQLYPLHKDKLKKIISQYSPNVEIVWAQEEPENMGAWYFMRDQLDKLGFDTRVIARKPSASPATGSEYKHKEEQEDILQRIWEGI